MEAVMEQLANFVTYITDSNVWGRILIAAVVVLGGLGVAFAMGAFSGDPVVVPD